MDPKNHYIYLLVEMHNKFPMRFQRFITSVALYDTKNIYYK